MHGKSLLRMSFLWLLGGIAFWPAPAMAMHISEGILPAPWAVLWFAVSVPFLWWGLRELRLRSLQESQLISRW